MRLQADSEDSGQPVRMHRLIGAFAGRTCSLVRNAVPRLIFHMIIRQSANVLFALFLQSHRSS